MNFKILQVLFINYMISFTLIVLAKLYNNDEEKFIGMIEKAEDISKILAEETDAIKAQKDRVN